MRMFAVLDTGGSRDLLEALLDDGFIRMLPEEFDGEDRFVCALSRDRAGNDAVWTKWRPKIVFTYDKDGVNSEIYEWQELVFGKEQRCSQTNECSGATDGEERLYLGVLSERKFEISSDWRSVYETNDDKVFYKVIADLAYRFMVAEVIDETAEWCGHMSSVLVNFSKG